MQRRGTADDGFILCFALNLLFNYWLGVIAFILFVLHFWLRIPLFLSFMVSLIWVGTAFVGTALIYWASKSGNEPTPERKNLNPYSAKNSDVFETNNIDVSKTIDKAPAIPSADAYVTTSDTAGISKPVDEAGRDG